MKNIKLTGKIRVLPAGHKVEGKPTWFRDEQGHFHAEFYKASIGEVKEDGKYHSYSWNVSADEAEALANHPMGTTFTVELLPKTKTVVNAAGVDEVVERTTASANGDSIYHDVQLLDIEVAKMGSIKLPRVTQYFSDVRFEDPAGNAEPEAEV